MVRRGVMGNYSLLGVPRTKEGFAITFGIFAGAGVIWRWPSSSFSRFWV